MSGNTKDFKVRSGIKPTSYYEGVGTVVSGSENYSIAGASYDGVSANITTGTNTYKDIAFSNDGTKLFTADSSLNYIREYSLSTAFDLTTRTYVTLFSVSSQEGSLQSIAFNNDGTKLYVVGINTDSVHQYSLSTGFDISTASYDSVSFSIASEETLPTCVRFNNDGTKMYILGNINDTVFQYTLSTAFDVSTASYDNINFVASAQDTSLGDLAFNSDGTIMYILGSLNDSVHQYSLSTAFDVGTASYDSISFNVGGQDSNPTSIVFNNDGSKMYILGYVTETIYQYSTVQTTNTLDLSTGSVFEITPTSDIQINLSNPAASGTVSQATLLLDGAGVSNGYDLGLLSFDQSFSVSGQDTQANDLAFNSDGTKMFVLGLAGDDVNEYTLSTAWDISTASFVDSFSVAAQTGTSPYSIFFKSDGTKFYVMSNTNDRIYQYSMSTAWDISTSSYDNKSHPTDNTNPRHLWFKPDGTVVYYTDEVADLVYGETLSTAWDISTAGTYQSFLDYSGTIGNSAAGVAFNDDGTKVFVIDSASNEIYYWDLSTAWNLTTATLNTNLTVPSISAPQGITFGDSGKKMYLANLGSSVYQYTTGEDVPHTLTYDTSLQWAGGTAPTSPAVGETDVLTFSTDDGGTTYKAVQAIDGAA